MEMTHRYLQHGTGRHEVDMPADVVDALQEYVFGEASLADNALHRGESWEDRAVRRNAPPVLRGAIAALCHSEEHDVLPVLPPIVAAVYVWDPFAWPAYDCKRCGYPIPAHMAGDRLDGDVEWLWFDRCPLCGAVVPGGG